MHRKAANILLLFCAFLLPLPQGWCCMLPSRASAQGAADQTIQPRSCCGHCSRASGSSSPQRNPLPADKCPCGDRQGAKPQLVKVLAGELLQAILPLEIPAPDPVTSYELVTFLPISLLDPPLHLLLCSLQC
jgi:hypothetical protein